MQDFEGLDKSALVELVKSQAEAIRKLTEERQPGQGVCVPVPVPLPVPVPIGSGANSPAGGGSLVGSPTKPAPIWGAGPGPPGQHEVIEPVRVEGGEEDQTINLNQDYYQEPAISQVQKIQLSLAILNKGLTFPQDIVKKNCTIRSGRNP